MAFQSQSLRLLSASSQYASIADGSQTGLDITGDITIEGWVKLSSLPSTWADDGHIFSRWETNSNQRAYRLAFNRSTNEIQFYVTSDGTYNESTTAMRFRASSNVLTSNDLNKWIHVAVTRDASAGNSGVQFYINGQPVTTIQEGSANFTGGFNSTSPASIGCVNVAGSPAQFMEGLLKNVRVFNDVRTGGEVASDMLAQSVTDANLVAEWKLEGDYLDSTANNNDLTASGSPIFVSDVPFSGVNDTDWTTSKKIFIPTGKVSGSSNLSDFPVLIKDGSIPDAIYSALQSDGKDLRITTDSTGTTEIPFEIVAINTSAKTAEIWAKVPTVYYNQNTDLYLWAGNAGATAYTAGAYFGQWNVWSGERAVYHLNDDTTSTTIDSTSSANNLTKTAANQPLQIDAKVGKGQDFAGGSRDLRGTNPTSWRNDTTGTLRFWLYVPSENATFETIFNYGHSGGTSQFFNANLNLMTISFQVRLNGSGNAVSATSSNLVGNSWNYYSISSNGSAYQVTINGVVDSGLSVTPVGTGANGDWVGDVTNINQFSIGSRWRSSTDAYYVNELDEVRITNAVLSADWIATEYTMMSDPEGFVVSVLPATVITNAVDLITSISARGNGEVTDDGGGTISERGIVYALTPNPDTDDDKITSGSGLGSFSSNLTGLTLDTHYYVRAYAINEAGTSYGANVEFDTLDAVISGVATNAGVPVEGAVITLIDSGTDEVVATDTTNASGEYAFTGLDVTKQYHVAAEYADGYDLYNAKSLPFMTPEEV